MHTTALPTLCQRCKRPIGGASLVVGGAIYHLECTHGPDYQEAQVPEALSEEGIRRIVREEVTNALRGHDLRGNFRCGARTPIY
jgi:hypothetical protein